MDDTAFVGYGRLLRPLWRIFSYTSYHMSLRYQGDMGVCRGVLARWPLCRMRQSIHYRIGMQQTSAYRGTISCYKRGRATVPGILLRLRQGVLFDHSGREGGSSRNEAGSKTFAWFRVCALWLYYLSGTSTLCSFIYEDVGEPTSHPYSLLKWQRITYMLFKTWVTWNIHMLNLLWFPSSYSPTCGNSQSKTKCFNDRLSLERAPHGHQKRASPDRRKQVYAQLKGALHYGSTSHIPLAADRARADKEILSDPEHTRTSNIHAFRDIGRGTVLLHFPLQDITHPASNCNTVREKLWIALLTMTFLLWNTAIDLLSTKMIVELFAAAVLGRRAIFAIQLSTIEVGSGARFFFFLWWLHGSTKVVVPGGRPSVSVTVKESRHLVSVLKWQLCTPSVNTESS